MGARAVEDPTTGRTYALQLDKEEFDTEGTEGRAQRTSRQREDKTLNTEFAEASYDEDGAGIG